MSRGWETVLPAGAVLILSLTGCQGPGPQTQTQTSTQTQTQAQAQAPVAAAKTDLHPLNEFSQEITSPIHEFSVKRGGFYSLPVTVKNTGNEIWAAGGQPMTVSVGYRWIDNGAALPLEGARAQLAHDLHPGESETVSLQIAADAPVGSHDVSVSMVQEGVTWFNLKGGSPLVLRAKIT